MVKPGQDVYTVESIRRDGSKRFCCGLVEVDAAGHILQSLTVSSPGEHHRILRLQVQAIVDEYKPNWVVD